MKTSNMGLWSGLAAGLFIVGIVAPQRAEAQAAKPKWDTSAALGLTLTRGNSETALFNANVNSKGDWANYAISLGASATYGENNGVRNNDNYKLFGQYDRKISEKFYVFGRAEYMHDAVADLEYRFKLNPGFGWHVIKNDRLTLDAEIGPGYVFEDKGGISDSYATLRLGEKATYKLSDTARLWQSAEFIPAVERFSNYLLAFEIGVEADITKRMSLRAVVQDDYTNEPAAGRKANDIKLITGIAYKF